MSSFVVDVVVVFVFVFVVVVDVVGTVVLDCR